MCTLAHFCLLLAAATIAPADVDSPPMQRGGTAVADVQFDAPRVVVPAGAQRAVCVRLVSPAAHDTPLEATSSDPGIAAITRSPTALAGESLAFLRIRGVKSGDCELRIGGASTHVSVIESEGVGAPVPVVTGPANGAVVWGAFASAVELSDLEEPLRAYAGDVFLRLSDGTTIKPIASTGPEKGPTRRAVFIVDSEKMRSATLELEPVWLTGDGTEHAGTPVTIRVAHPNEGGLNAGEAEARYDVERPKRFSRPPRRGDIGSDKGASGGKYLNNPGSEPALCFPVKVEEDGWYEVMLTARGILAGGAYPTVGLVIDGAQYAATNARVPDEKWRRFAVGVPVRLNAGEHVLTPFFENDFYVQDHCDRNLYLDKIEVLRVPPGATPALDGAGMMMQGMMNSSAPEKSMPAASAKGGSKDGNVEGAMMSMAGMGGATNGSPVAPDPWGLSPRAVRIALERPLDGAEIAGELAIDGLCWWEREGMRAPRVTLVVNGVPRDSQRSAAPHFVIDPAIFPQGDNTIELVATLDSGATDRTPPQHLHAAAATTSNQSARRYLRYTVHDDGWDEAVTKSLSTDKGPPERRAAAFFSGVEGMLTLPPDLAGTFEVSIESFGQEFDGPPILAATLVTDQGRQPIGEAKPGGWWTPRSAGTVELHTGPKKLAIAFTNDKYEENKGDRNVWFQAVVLKETAPPDAAPPTARIAYPGAGATMGMVDAVVADFSDDRAATRVELLLDGNPTGVSLDVTGKPGRMLLPLITRGVTEGPHSLGVRVTDASGKTGDSAPVQVNLSLAASGEPGDYERAVRLLNRLGFGPEPEELAAVLTQGADAWLRSSLTQSADDPGELAAMGFATTRFPGGRGEYEVSRRPITHALLTRNSVRARFVLWTENHFSTWVRKTEGDRKWREHVAFARLGAAPFFDLLEASATSPAMLRYLDQEESYAGRLNENYAREVMELHTLGVKGGYTQSDVTNLAHLLTGWTTAREGDGMSAGEMRGWEFTFDPQLSEGKATRVVGVAYDEASPENRYDRVRFALEVLAAHPSTARFVCRKVVEHYVSVPAPESMVDDLAERFTETGGDMAEVLIALAHHPEFTRPDLPDRLAHPLEFGLRLARTTHLMNPWLIADYMQRSGNGLFDRSTPDGYPEEDSAYVDSNAMLQRWRLAKDAEWPLAGLVPDPIRYGEIPKDETEAARWMQQVVDLISVRLTGRLLGAESNAAALGVLKTTHGNRQDRIFQAAPFIAQLPEASLR